MKLLEKGKINIDFESFGIDLNRYPLEEEVKLMLRLIEMPDLMLITARHIVERLERYPDER